MGLFFAGCQHRVAPVERGVDSIVINTTERLIQGDSLSIALDRAVQFVTLGIRATFGQGLPSREGILLERILGSLFAPVSACKSRLMDGDGCHTPAAPFEG